MLDIGRFLGGKVATERNAQCSLLCPVTGKGLAVAASELADVMAVPADSWQDCDGPIVGTDGVLARRVGLARRGILIGDPPFEGWEALDSGERALEQAQWLDLAAVFHAHSRWEGVVGADLLPKDDMRSAALEALLRARGEPPTHFVERADAHRRIALRLPALSGPFFDTLLARRTTRAFRTDEPVPLAPFEQLLYATFGTHGIRHYAPGVTAIKRTSPSGGALHSIEGYVLAINVEGVPAGLYHYETGAHSLAELERLDVAGARELAAGFTAGQTYFAQAHALVVHVARFERSFWKYSHHRKAYKSILMDSGHLSQTFYLTAAHLGLGAFYTAAINDGDISERLGLAPGKEAAIAINGVGLAATGHDELHFVPVPYVPGRTA